MIIMVIIDTERSAYSAEEAGKKSITVGELIEILSEYDEDDVVITGHDNRYTYGHIESYSVEYYEES